MNVTTLRGEWLTNNAVVAFVSALLMGQSWSVPGGTTKLFGVLPGWDQVALITFLVIAVLFVLSMFFAIAACVPRLQRWALRTGSIWSPTLSLLTWVTFTAALPPALMQQPWDQWWSACMILGGTILCVFLLIRCLRQFIQVHQYRSSTHSHDGHILASEDESPVVVTDLTLAILRNLSVIDNEGNQARIINRGDVQAVLGYLASINASGLTAFNRLNLRGADLRGLDLSSCSFEGCDLSHVIAHPLVQVGGRDLPVGDPGANAAINRWERGEDVLDGVDVQPTCFENAMLTDATLDDGDFNFAIMTGVNLNGAHVEGARFYKAKLSGARIRFSHFTRADLRRACLDRADLYASDFDRCLFDNVDWGLRLTVLQESQKNWDDAVHVYSTLTRVHELAGLAETAGEFRYLRERAKSKRIRQEVLDRSERGKASLIRNVICLMRYIGRVIADVVCGFGERPWRAAMAFVIVIAVGAPLYVEYTSIDVSSAGIVELFKRAGHSAYFSAASTSGLGYGSWVGDEVGWSKYLGVIQSVLGTLFAALFVVTITRRWFR